jgi:hypothetical protein
MIRFGVNLFFFIFLSIGIGSHAKPPRRKDLIYIILSDEKLTKAHSSQLIVKNITFFGLSAISDELSANKF